MSEPVPPRVYFDTSVYIANFLDEPGKADMAETALTGAIQREVKGFISALVVAEATGAPSVRAPQKQRPGMGRSRSRKLAAFMDALPFTYIEGGRPAARRAAELAAAHHLKGPDALHLALAELARCDHFYTFDHDQLKLQRLDGMRISEPRGVVQPEIPFA